MQQHSRCMTQIKLRPSGHAREGCAYKYIKNTRLVSVQDWACRFQAWWRWRSDVSFPRCGGDREWSCHFQGVVELALESVLLEVLEVLLVAVPERLPARELALPGRYNSVYFMNLCVCLRLVVFEVQWQDRGLNYNG